MLWLYALLALTATVQGRAVNISNTWMLPEEGFPVFYRYFRDRISWYEADAVCQFHHANLVTVDTTAQYDAVRAYLKELDITSAVWVGLIRSNPDGDFTWTDYRGLSGDGYWSSAPDAGAAPLCAAADPAADFRWETRACGGPMVASFICELPVPQWASGSQGCMVKSLPALTILYLPESAAVQLTADCGLAGVRKVECTGNVKREELMQELSCVEDSDEVVTTPAYELSTGSSWPVSTELSIFSHQTTQEIIDEVTEQPRNQSENNINEQTSTAEGELKINTASTPVIEYHTVAINQDFGPSLIDKSKVKTAPINTFNLESNDIPKLPEKENFISEDETNKLEDEKLMQHKMLHDELARLGNTGNFEKIFTHSSDHFIPPLVMAKSRMVDDMAELSVHEKQAQQIAEEHYNRYEMSKDKSKSDGEQNQSSDTTATSDKISVSVTSSTTEISIETTPKLLLKDKENKESKQIRTSPKKYSEKYYDPKSKSIKSAEKIFKKRIEKITDVRSDHQNHINSETTTPSIISSSQSPHEVDNFQPLELSIVLKEPVIELKEIKPLLSTESGDKVYIAETKYKNSELESTTEIKPLKTEIITQAQTESVEELTHKIVQVTIPNDNDESTPIVLEIATLMPVYKTSLNTEVPSKASNGDDLTNNSSTTSASSSIPQNDTTEINQELQSTSAPLTSSYADDSVAKLIMTTAENTAVNTEQHIKSTSVSTTVPQIITSSSIPSVVTKISDDANANATETGLAYSDDNSQNIDDFESPLLSGASEPLHRPNRSRRPQNQNHVKKFNPFRILG